ncbi:hypothetical protein BGY98DRAFT_1030897 [Russula aff. rugulosa BPL654]|nr:hypothetical protein BGY98DRAFT_1030897 [Russula aff. rugulosa BPL654]
MGCHHITRSLRFPHPATPLPIRIQAARTLDDIFAIVPRHLMAAPIDLQAAKLDASPQNMICCA